ncbi:hypothetical protein [Veronia pacifica]|uniref:Transcriptional regulator n=1 Tax=Veronia pacifica TaxID=1080227 RepID=A0A1C3EB32_9GAMM|nr:hypothetical protein [Veronia pacifica]ODA30467.1 hypothetical protein A8L45_20230 [Veronia pacifica]
MKTAGCCEGTEIDYWLTDIKNWYCNQNINEMGRLLELVVEVPERIFTPHICQAKSESLGYWLDACIRTNHHLASMGKTDEAYSYIQFAYGKMQAMASNTEHEIDVRRWCMQRMDKLMIVLVEFCQHQQQPVWRQESSTLIDAHVTFMTAQNHMNMSGSQVTA